MKMRKIIALLLALCMLLSLSISAFAADDVVASGTIPDSKIKWALDSNGWLTISGSGEAPVFQSADGQPWAEYREQITEVWFEDMETLNIPDLAYWFEGCTALTDELTAFQNHTAAIPAKQRAMIFTASSYEEILTELDSGQENQNTRLQTYREVYDCLKLPLFLLPCNETGVLQLRIMGVPNYRELLARIILKSHYVPPPANRTMYDALYQCVPFIMAADMNLRRIDAAVEVARSDSLSQIVLAALPEQVEAVLNRRYRETGKARVFTITDAALRELLGSTAPYTPPDLPFYTSEGSVLDVPPLKAP